jgi:hypothetical protein
MQTGRTDRSLSMPMPRTAAVCSSVHSPQRCCRRKSAWSREAVLQTAPCAWLVLSSYPPALSLFLPMSMKEQVSQYNAITLQLFASISAQRALAFSLFCFATSLFLAVRSRRSARRHMLTSCLRLVHMPIVFHMKPLAWHSSSAVMISSQPGKVVRPLYFFLSTKKATGSTNRHCLSCGGEDAWCKKCDELQCPEQKRGKMCDALKLQVSQGSRPSRGEVSGLLCHTKVWDGE